MTEIPGGIKKRLHSSSKEMKIIYNKLKIRNFYGYADSDKANQVKEQENRGAVTNSKFCSSAQKIQDQDKYRSSEQPSKKNKLLSA